jgi:hypothetical protein
MEWRGGHCGVDWGGMSGGGRGGFGAGLSGLYLCLL